MFHVFGKVYADHIFNRSRNFTGFRVVDINNNLLMEEVNLQEVFNSYGDLATFLECLFALHGKAYILLNEEDFHGFYVALLCSSFPKMSLTMTHRLSKLLVLKHKYAHSNFGNNTYNSDDYSISLTIPKWEDTQRFYQQAQTFAKLPTHISKTLGMEFLLGHALANHFADSDEYVQIFTQKLKNLSLRVLTNDLIKLRRNMIMDVCRASDHVGFSIDIDREDIDTQIESGLLPAVTDRQLTIKNVDYLRQHYLQILREVGSFYFQNEMSQKIIHSVLMTDSFDTQDARQLVDIDRFKEKNNLFIRSAMVKAINDTLVSYLYQAPQAELDEFQLN